MQPITCGAVLCGLIFLLAPAVYGYGVAAPYALGALLIYVVAAHRFGVEAWKVLTHGCDSYANRRWLLLAIVVVQAGIAFMVALILAAVFGKPIPISV